MDSITGCIDILIGFKEKKINYKHPEMRRIFLQSASKYHATTACVQYLVTVNEMKNRILVSILFASLAGVIIGLAVDNTSYNIFRDMSINLFALTGVYFLVKNGSFIYTQEFRIIGLSIAAVLIGSIFKIMHWQGANLLLGIGWVSLLLLYLIHFLRKQEKNLFQIGKLAFLFTFITGKLFQAMHWPMNQEISFLSLILLVWLLGYSIQSKRYLL